MAAEYQDHHLLHHHTKFFETRSPCEIMAERKRQERCAAEKLRARGLSADEENVRVADPWYARAFAPPRSYAQQSCYHQTGSVDPDGFVFCDAERCTYPDVHTGYPDGGYCENTSRDCYDRDGKLILDENGKSITDSISAVFVKWDMCL